MVINKKSITNCHGHVVPEDSEIPESIKNAKYFRIIEKPEGGQIMFQDFIPGKKPWTRPVQHKAFFVKPYLEWAEKKKVSTKTEKAKKLY